MACERPVVAGMKQVAPVAAQAQRLHGGPQLDAPVMVFVSSSAHRRRKIVRFGPLVEFGEQPLRASA